MSSQVTSLSVIFQEALVCFIAFSKLFWLGCKDLFHVSLIKYFVCCLILFSDKITKYKSYNQKGSSFSISVSHFFLLITIRNPLPKQSNWHRNVGICIDFLKKKNLNMHHFLGH